MTLALVAACSTSSVSPVVSVGTAPPPGTAPTTTVELTATTEAVLVDLPLVVTPSQTEGPFYPPEKPVDRDADLTVVEGGPGPAAGKLLIIDGVLLYENGEPVAGAVVEIWQVDNQGIYLHPNSPNLPARDQNFQGYGETLTSAQGVWSFVTIAPPTYEGRPRHIHLKVRLDGVELLTTQIYFEGDPLLAGDQFFAAGGEGAESLVIDPEVVTLDSGESVLHADHRIVLAG